MSRASMHLVLALGMLFGTADALGASFAVGSCKPTLPSFATISAAVATVPPSSTVLVCPGTYPEQVTINRPLTLQGVISANSGQAVITVPLGGLTQNVTSTVGGPVPIYAQLGVTATAGPVNITDITVDGTNNNVNGSDWLAGLFYQSGSSGVVNEVTTCNQINFGLGVGIWIENADASSPQSVTVKNSSVHDVDGYGIVAQDASLNAIITGNSVLTPGAFTAIYAAASGSTTNNAVTASSMGIWQVTPGIVSGNTVLNSAVGIYSSGIGSSETGNKTFNSQVGIRLAPDGQTVKGNTITQSNIAIDFGCSSGDIVSGNKINDAAFGLNRVLSNFSGANSFFNVGTVRVSGCGFAPTLPLPKVHIPTMSH